MSAKDQTPEWIYHAGKVVRCPDCGKSLMRLRPGLMECTKCGYIDTEYALLKEV